MRVALVTWRFPEPTEPFIVRKVAALVERGIEVVVFANALATGADADPPALRAVRDEVEVRTVAARTGWRSARSPLLTAPADVVHFEHAGVALSHRHLLPHLAAPSVVTCRGSTVRVDVLRRPGLQLALGEVFAAVDRVHCVSTELAERCRELGARADQLLVAPTGVDLSLFTPRTGPPRPEGLAVRLVSIGRLHWVKGYEHAVQAVRLLRDRGHRVSYTIAGADEGAESAIRLAVRDLGLEDAVTLVGHLPPERVHDLLVASDVFLLPSLSEGASGATMQAMATGLPVVVTDVGGMREVVRDGVHGRVVPSRDPQALASAVEELLEPSVRRAMGSRALDEARARFDDDVLIDRHVEVYRELVRAAGEPMTARPVSPAPAPDGHDLVSVVLVAHDAADTIDDQLRALSFQRHSGPWEVVVVDNRSTDGTRERALAWADRLPGLRVVDAPDRAGIGYARNVGVRAARGAHIVMCDADDVVAPGWLAELATALAQHPLVVGPLERSLLMPGSDEDAVVDAEAQWYGTYRRKFLTGNCGFHRDVHDAVGGFDESLPRGSDVDFGWRAMDRGFGLTFVGGAVVHYRARSRPSAVFRQALVDGQVRHALAARHRKTGLTAPSPREVVDRHRSLLRALRPALRSRPGRVAWLYEAGNLVGAFGQRGSRP
ncbi:MAG: glycosyltransferase [Acidimicrobiia bacterium]|nr:glycosyltransferase [Acidimicrobiia bacterium]